MGKKKEKKKILIYNYVCIMSIILPTVSFAISGVQSERENKTDALSEN